MIQKINEVSRYLPAEYQSLYQGRKGILSYKPVEVRKGVMAGPVEAGEYFRQEFVQGETDRKSFIVLAAGPMAGGKSTLIGEVAGLFPEALVVKHSLDLTRYGRKLVNHSGVIHVPAETYTEATDILDLLPKKTKLVLIDEIQFAQGDARKLVEGLRRRGVRALIAGLDLDFKKDPWGTTNGLLEVTDESIILPAICTNNGCRRPAFFTQRFVNGEPAYRDDPVIQVGGIVNDYTSRCSGCHVVRPSRNGRSPQ